MNQVRIKDALSLLRGCVALLSTSTGGEIILIHTDFDHATCVEAYGQKREDRTTGTQTVGAREEVIHRDAPLLKNGKKVHPSHDVTVSLCRPPQKRN